MTNRFQKLALATTATTYLLILVGALVRAAGAGLGCPDWPRCFERWIPPTDIAQVPAELASRFNVRLAWIEYLNRLLGVLTGFLIFATLVMAVRHYRRAPRVLWPSVGAFLGVAFEGWLGSKVVKHELDPSIVTAHLIVALVVVSLLLYATVCAFSPDGRPMRLVPRARRQLGALTLGVTGVMLLQVALGTRVRSALELVARAAPDSARGEWIARIGPVDHAHRTMALVVLGLVVGLAVFVRRRLDPSPALRHVADALVLGVLAQILAGVGLAYLALPPVLQVFHVVVGSLLLGGLMTLALLAYRLPVAPGGPQDADAATDPLDPAPTEQALATRIES